jgi:hypothetical protein
MRYAGFVSLPIEGESAVQLERALDQIQTALVEQQAEHVERVGNRITFSAGFLSLKRSVRGNPLTLITLGEIEVNPTSDSLMVDYRLSFSQLFIFGVIAALIYLATSMGRISAQPLSVTLFVSTMIWLVMFAGNAAFAVSRFSRLLGEFPREN